MRRAWFVLLLLAPLSCKEEAPAAPEVTPPKTQGPVLELESVEHVPPYPGAKRISEFSHTMFFFHQYVDKRVAPVKEVEEWYRALLEGNAWKDQRDPDRLVFHKDGYELIIENEDDETMISVAKLGD